MNWQFWKKGDVALPELSSFDKPGGLDLTGGFEPNHSANAGLPGFGAANQGFGGTQSAFPPPMPQTNSFPSSFNTGSGVSSQSFSPQGYTQQPMEESGHNSVQKDLEVITAKLDTIRAQLEMLNTRIANMERQDQQVQPKRPWY